MPLLTWAIDTLGSRFCGCQSSRRLNKNQVCGRRHEITVQVTLSRFGFCRAECCRGSGISSPCEPAAHGSEHLLGVKISTYHGVRFPQHFAMLSPRFHQVDVMTCAAASQLGYMEEKGTLVDRRAREECRPWWEGEVKTRRTLFVVHESADIPVPLADEDFFNCRQVLACCID